MVLTLTATAKYGAKTAVQELGCRAVQAVRPEPRVHRPQRHPREPQRRRPREPRDHEAAQTAECRLSFRRLLRLRAAPKTLPQAQRRGLHGGEGLVDHEAQFLPHAGARVQVHQRDERLAWLLPTEPRHPRRAWVEGHSCSSCSGQPPAVRLLRRVRQMQPVDGQGGMHAGSSWREPAAGTEQTLFACALFEGHVKMSSSSRVGPTPTPTCPAGQGGCECRCGLRQDLAATKRQHHAAASAFPDRKAFLYLSAADLSRSACHRPLAG